MPSIFVRYKVATLITAVGVSEYGDWLTTIALVVKFYQITGNQAWGPTAYILARVAPRVAGPALGGVLTDRISPQAVMITCSCLQAIFVLALLPELAGKDIALLLLTVAILQLLGAVAKPALPALIPRIAPVERLGAVNAIYSTVSASSIFVAPAAGAVMLAAVGYEALLIADALSFALAAILIAALRPLGRPAPAAAGTVHTAVDTTAMLVKTPLLRALAAANLAGGSLVTTVQGTLVIAAAEHFGGSAQVGWLYAAVGLGGLATSVFFIWRSPRGISTALVIVASLANILPLALFTLATNLGTAMLLLAMSSAAEEVALIGGATALQHQISPAQLGRVNGAMVLMTYVGMLVGAVAGLVISPWLGWRAAVLAVLVFGLAVVGIAAAPFPKQAELAGNTTMRERVDAELH